MLLLYTTRYGINHSKLRPGFVLVYRLFFMIMRLNRVQKCSHGVFVVYSLRTHRVPIMCSLCTLYKLFSKTI